jgi:hypothetical protein
MTADYVFLKHQPDLKPMEKNSLGKEAVKKAFEGCIYNLS